MKLLDWIISLVVFALSFWWASKIHNYFFGLTQADLIGLLIVSGAAFILFQRFRENESPWLKYLTTIVFTSLVFGLYYTISQLILITDLSWLTIYVFLLTSIWFTSSLAQSNLKYLGLSVLLVNLFVPYEFSAEQLRFFDRVESSTQTREGHAQLVRWKDDLWLYYNDQLQYSTIDKHIYQEAYVQPAMQIVENGAQVLLIGGESGIVEDELTKFQQKIALTILPIDIEFYRFTRAEESLDLKEFAGKKVVQEVDVFEYLSDSSKRFDLIIVDLPDPVSLSFQQFYTVEFYELIKQSLHEKGFFVSQTGDLYKNGTAVQQTWNSVTSAGMEFIPLQCQIPTLGQWTWVIAFSDRKEEDVRRRLARINPTDTKWWNQEASNLMTSFGKDYFLSSTREANYIVKPKTSANE